VNEQLISLSKIRKKEVYSTAHDSCDVANFPVLVTYVCFINPVVAVTQEFLLRELPARNTGEEIFQLLENVVTGSGFD
jgi:hypothetical protein